MKSEMTCSFIKQENLVEPTFKIESNIQQPSNIQQLDIDINSSEKRKRIRPDDVDKKLENTRLLKKKMKGFYAGYFHNTEADKFVKITKDDMNGSAQIVRLLIEKEHKLYNPFLQLDMNTLNFCSQVFAPYYYCNLQIGTLLMSHFGFDLPDLLNDVECTTFLGKENIVTLLR